MAGKPTILEPGLHGGVEHAIECAETAVCSLRCRMILRHPSLSVLHQS